MAFRPVKATVVQIGNSAGLIVPAPIAEALGFEPGDEWHVRLRHGGRAFTAQARRMGGSVGVLVPADVLRRQGVEVGHELDVPFLTWQRAA